MRLAEYITVISGYPRSGTSMMMGILEAGGMEVLHDEGFRPPSKHNPKGFYEYRAALSLGTEEGTSEWVATARGKAVKVIAYQLRHLPAEYSYKVIFMRRKIAEILASGREMGIVRENISLSEREQVLAFKGEYVRYEIWLARQLHMEATFLNYNDVLARPREELEKVRRFLGVPLDLEGMVAAIDPGLHRHRDGPANVPGTLAG